MKPLLLSILICILFLSCDFLKGFNEYELKWKLKKDEILAYDHVQEVNDTVYKNISGLALSAIDSLIYSDNGDNLDINEILKNVNENQYTATLTKAADNKIDVNLILNNPKGSRLESIFPNLGKGIVLNGEITEQGKISSFYLSEKQRNLLALLFQLPDKPVHIGDSWQIDVNLVTISDDFKCDESEKRNVVSLIDVVEKENSSTGVVKYDILHRVKGKIKHPFLEKTIEVQLQYSYTAVALFDITRGRWIDYKANMHVKSTGLENIDVTSVFVLSELSEVPKKIIGIIKPKEKQIAKNNNQYKSKKDKKRNNAKAEISSDCPAKYYVQLLSAPEKITKKDKRFKNLNLKVKELYYPKSKKYKYKYVVGGYCTNEEAQKLKSQIKDSGFPNAFVLTVNEK